MFPCTSFVMDVYVDRRDKVWLLDFNVFDQMTDSILFTWNELHALAAAGTAAAAAAAAAHSTADNTGTTATHADTDVIRLQLAPAATKTASIDDVIVSAGTVSSSTLLDDRHSDSSSDSGSDSGSDADASFGGATCVSCDAATSTGTSYSYEFRLVESDSSALSMSDPMGQYRGPCEAELWGASGASQNAVDFDALREILRNQE
jgi:D123